MSQPPEIAPDPNPFDEPWQAQAFAMTLALHDQGQFTWKEWAEILSDVLHDEQSNTPSNSEYYRCWLLALERVLLAKSLTDIPTIEATTARWHRAAHNTPHGMPILLKNA